MNILLFSRIIAKSGVGNHIRQLSLELVRQGHKVIVVSSTNDLGIGEGTSLVEFEKINVTSLNPIKIIKRVNTLHKLIRDRNIEIVHCHHRMAALYMKVYKMFYNIPMVYTLHLADVPSDFFHRIMTYVGDKAIGVSTEVSDFLVEKLKVPHKKVVTICNGVDEMQLQKLTLDEERIIKRKWSLEDNKIVFAMHSRIDEVKNHMLVVEAVKLMSDEERKKIKVICSGLREGDYYTQVVNSISAYGLENVFSFTGWTSTREILGIADALVLSSFNEGFPLSVVEAFLMKVPVLRTRTGGFDDQKYCYELKLNNPEQVKNAMLDVMNNYDIFRQKAEEAYQYALQNFTIENMTNKTIEIYKSIINL